jgi:ubiquinone biosynthesis protein
MHGVTNADWLAFLDELDFGRLVPEAYHRYRPAVADGLGFFLENLPAARALAILADQADLAEDATIEARLVAMARHCPALHKLGQVLARDRRLPETFRALLQSLESMPSSCSVEAARAAVEAEIGPLAPRGIRIDEPPIAEASVAIVVPFVWREVGEDTDRHGVFKILKEGVEAKLHEDLDLLQRIGALLDERCDAYVLPRIDYEATFLTVRDLLACEVRLDQEQAHMAEARHVYRDMARVVVPEVHYLSTPRLTAMQRIFGRKVTDVAAVPAARRRALAETVVRTLIGRPMWSDGVETLFHADPHAGNLFLTDDGRLAILDWSLVGRLRKRDQVGLTQILLGALTLDAVRIAGAVTALADDRVDQATLARIVERRIAPMRDGGFPGFGWLTGIMDEAAIDAGARFAGSLVMFRKVLQTLDGVVHDIAADCRVDRVLAMTLATTMAREFRRRAYAEPLSRDFASHFSTLDLTQLAMSSPLIGTRLALALQEDWLAAARAARDEDDAAPIGGDGQAAAPPAGV